MRMCHLFHILIIHCKYLNIIMQMKKILLSLLFLFLLGNIDAQNFNFGIPKYENLDKYIVIDSAHIKCAYTLTYIKDTLKLQEKSVDKQVLLIGKNISKYYSQYALDYNLFLKKEISKGVEAVPTIPQKGAWSYELFKNYPSKKETVTDISSMLHDNYLYEEDLPILSWKISDGKQTIMSYSCQKATVSFRGRDFIAWFTTEIPTNNGPWKFGGLPGLILRLSDTKNHFVYQCDGLERLKTKEPIKFYKVEYTTLSRNELAKLYQRYHNDMAAFLKVMGIRVHEYDEKTNSTKKIEHSQEKIPYNPIELE